MASDSGKQIRICESRSVGRSVSQGSHVVASPGQALLSVSFSLSVVARYSAAGPTWDRQSGRAVVVSPKTSVMPFFFFVVSSHKPKSCMVL